MMLVRTMIGLALMVALAACGDSGGSDAGDDPASILPITDPAGATYVVTGVTDGGTAKPLAEGSEVRLAFTPTKLTITGGCNTMTGGYTLDGTELTVSQLAMTQMACPQPLMDQDTWLAALFEEPVTFEAKGDAIEDGATITSGEVVLTLADRNTVSPDRSLDGTHWALDTIFSANAASSVPAGVEAWVEFDDAKVTVNDGCNTGNGSSETTATTIDFGPRGTTRMFCEGTQDVERAFAEVLDGRTTYVIEEDVLRITKGDQALAFRAAADSAAAE